MKEQKSKTKETSFDCPLWSFISNNSSLSSELYSRVKKQSKEMHSFGIPPRKQISHAQSTRISYVPYDPTCIKSNTSPSLQLPPSSAFPPSMQLELQY